MIGLIFAAALLSGVQSNIAGAERCNLSSFKGLEWVGPELTPEFAQHQALRSKAGAKLPGTSLISIYGSAAHHTSVRFSLMLVPGNDGHLLVDGADEQGPGLVQIPTVYTRFAEPLTETEAAEVRLILNDPCLQVEPHGSYDRSIVVGGTFVTLEIHTPSVNRRMSGYGKVPGLSGKLLEVIYEAAARAQKLSAGSAN